MGYFSIFADPCASLNAIFTCYEVSGSDMIDDQLCVHGS